jgi:hypothetical protein
MLERDQRVDIPARRPSDPHGFTNGTGPIDHFQRSGVHVGQRRKNSLGCGRQLITVTLASRYCRMTAS